MRCVPTTALSDWRCSTRLPTGGFRANTCTTSSKLHDHLAFTILFVYKLLAGTRSIPTWQRCMPQHGYPEMVFTGAAELLRWTASVGIKRAPLRLRLELPGLSQQEQLRWQQLLERSHNDCGCSAAATGLLAFVTSTAAYAVLVGFAQPLWLRAIVLLGAAVGILFLGKLIGHTWSRRKLRRHVTNIVQLVQGASTDESSR